MPYSNDSLAPLSFSDFTPLTPAIGPSAKITRSQCQETNGQLSAQHIPPTQDPLGDGLCRKPIAMNIQEGTLLSINIFVSVLVICDGNLLQSTFYSFWLLKQST